MFRKLNNVDKSTIYYNKAVSVFKQINSITGLESAYYNLSINYRLKKAFDLALECAERGMHFNNLTKIKIKKARLFSSIAAIYYELNQYDRALYYYKKGLIECKKQGDLDLEIDLTNDIATVLMEKERYVEAEPYLLSAYSLTKSNPSNIDIHTIINFNLGQLYNSINEYKSSVSYLNRYIQINDSLNESNNVKKLSEIEAKYQNEKKEEENKLLEEQLKNKSLQAYFAFGGIVLLGGLVFFIYRGFRLKKKANFLLEEKNETIISQKKLVDEKNKEITDSINYSLRIQKGLLNQEKKLSENLKDHFIYFQPKDIVSGDFYWTTNLSKLQAEEGKKFATVQCDLFYLAICDSTGHGVPGAFMSLLNMSFLSEAINEREISKPNDVFNYIRERLINVISDGGKDGFDGILLCVNKTMNKVTYCAANNAPILIRNNEIVELPKDKMPVGKGERNTNFTLQTMDVKENDVIYLYTDGYADQFGGQDLPGGRVGGKKFKYKKLNELLLSIYNKPFDEQKQRLQDTFNNWKGTLEQVDDVCVVGIKI